MAEIFSAPTFEVFKEPRGILRPIEFILSIFAFATTTSVTLNFKFSVNCVDGNTTVTKGPFSFNPSYPFPLYDYGLDGPVCNQSLPVKLDLFSGSSKSSAEFYVFVGVIVFLYCLASLVLYIMCDEFYRKNTRVTIADFVISAVLCLLWLISSSAWAQGLTDLKYYTDLDECGYFDHIPDCVGSVCKQDLFPNFASLNVSIIFGFLNMAVWGGNLWFLYKETPWHKVQQSRPATEPGVQSPEDPQRI